MNFATVSLFALLLTIVIVNGHTLYTVVSPVNTAHVTPLSSHSSSSVSVNTPHYKYNYGLSETKNHGAVISYGHTLVPVSYTLPEHVIQAQEPAKVKATAYNYNANAEAYTYQQKSQQQQQPHRILTFPSYVYTYTHPGHYVGVHTSRL